MSDQARQEAKPPRILLAILAKQKEPVLAFYLKCIEALDYPREAISLYVRTNNNTDRTAGILKEWLDRVGPSYAGVFFDDSNVSVPVEQYGVHEWNETRFRVLAQIRQTSMLRTIELGCDFYFVVDVDNFVRPGTLRELVALNLPIVGPLLRHDSQTHRYSNYHLDIDDRGYFKDSEAYDWLLAQQLRGVIQVNVIHCTYLVRADVIPKLRYEDGSGRHEYVVFSASAREAGVAQYLDNRQLYGYLTLEESTANSRALIGAEVDGWLKAPQTMAAPGEHRAATRSPNIVAHTKYGSIIVNIHDRFIGHDILHTGYWAEKDIELIRQLINARSKPPQEVVVYDVGANIGTHSLALAKIFGGRIKIRAFEAQSSIYNMLCGTMALNGLSNVKCHLNAVSNVDGESMQIGLPDYFQSNNFGGLELIPPKNSDNQGMAKAGATETVKTVTLDSFAETVHFIKMDIEGMEHIAIEGARETIARNRPICFIEVLKTHTDKLFAFFRAQNYVIYISGADAIFVPAESGIQIDGLKKLD